MQRSLSMQQKRRVMATVTKAKEICHSHECQPADAVLMLLMAAAYICDEHTHDPEKSLKALRDALAPAVFSAQGLHS